MPKTDLSDKIAYLLVAVLCIGLAGAFLRFVISMPLTLTALPFCFALVVIAVAFFSGAMIQVGYAFSIEALVRRFYPLGQYTFNGGIMLALVTYIIMFF